MSITAFTTSFTPASSAGTSTSTVTTASTAYDWFSLTGSSAFTTASSTMSTTTPVGMQNKAFVQTISNLARADLIPLIKAELFAAQLSSSKAVINNSINTIISTLTNILDPDFSSQITSLASTYNSTLAIITSTLNKLKSLEIAVHNVGTSLDVTSSSIATTFAATTTLVNFSGLKTFLATCLDPATLANNGNAITALSATGTNVGNASALLSIYNSASTALSASTIVADYKALIELSAKNVFDLYYAESQGYMSSGTSGNWASGSAPVGIVPGKDYEVHLTGSYQTGTAAAGTAGAPSATTDFW